MQSELEAEAPGAFAILGVNGIGYESSNSLIPATGATLPWLQDVASQNVWVNWAVEYRDVVIVDAQGLRRDVFNLTTHDLAQQTNRDALKERLRAVK